MKRSNLHYAAILIVFALSALCYVKFYAKPSNTGILANELSLLSSIAFEPIRISNVRRFENGLTAISTVNIEAMLNQTIHIVLVVAENNSPKRPGIALCERVETLLKSILTFYRGPLHVHMLTNTRSAATLSTLFRTWSLANVRTSFYNVEEDQNSLEWVKSTHAVDGYGQLKYIIHDILPEFVEKDIRVLHSYFDVLDRRVFFAAAPDQYRRLALEKTFGKGAKDRSVNSGLVLYNLRAMREGNWTSLWRATGVMLMNKLGVLQCPQDLLAAAAILHPEIYMKLPCEYNFQLGKYSLPWTCLKNESELWKAKIPHWTGQKKFNDDSLQLSAYFNPLYRCFQQLDGYEFEAKTGKELKYRTLTNLRNLKRTENVDDVTLATHVRFNEAVETMLRLNTAWKGPISLVVCGTSWDRAQLINFFFVNRVLHEQFSVHFVYQRNESCPEDYVRRLAIDSSRTNAVLLSDSKTFFKLDAGFAKNFAMSAQSRPTVVLRDRKTSQFAGALLEKTNAQLIAAGQLGIEEAIKNSKLKFDTIKVDSSPKSNDQISMEKWEMTAPSSDFCQYEMDRRRSI